MTYQDMIFQRNQNFVIMYHHIIISRFDLKYKRNISSSYSLTIVSSLFIMIIHKLINLLLWLPEEGGAGL